MTANLHVALAMALGRPPSDSDEQLIDRVYALRQGTTTTPPPPQADDLHEAPALFDLGAAS